MMTRLRSALSVAIAAALAAVVLTPAAPASAVDARDFDPGMIISDALFYDSSAMTAGQIQAFLEDQVRDCRPEWDSNPSDITCMKDFSQRTTSKSGNTLCDALPTRTQTAAQIINSVARACGISQKVLLVMLQKEQGLVTHQWPSSSRYDKAMGYACPDTAPCDTQYFGFFNQVYNAALQLKRYQANPANYGYRAGRTNLIKYHPHNTSCGTQSVYIRNQATAALYIYTPYVPNTAALNAGYGTGNSCSSYGNRNFFLYYNDWFESPLGIPVVEPITSAYADRGGRSALGDPVASQVKAPGGVYQEFDRGFLFVTDSGVVTYRVGSSNLTKRYMADGGPTGPWGWPRTDTETIDGVQLVKFEKATVWSDNGVLDPTVVHARLRGVWDRYGWATLGSVQGDPIVVDGGVYQEFNNGFLFVNADGDAAFRTFSALTDEYFESGGPTGPWGWPVSDAALVDGRQQVLFENAWTSTSGSDVRVRAVHPDLVGTWEARGDRSAVGEIVGTPVTGDGGVYQEFARGFLYVTDDGVDTFRLGRSNLTQRYMSEGGPAGPWGWPLTDTETVNGVQNVTFENATVYSTNGVLNPVLVAGPLRERWEADGGHNRFGRVLSAAVTRTGGTYQQFRNGYLFATTDGVTTYRLGRTSLTQEYMRLGGPAGPWGWPLTDAECAAGNYCIVQFETTTALSDNGSVTMTRYPLTGTVLDSWTERGGESSIGVPTSKMYVHPGGDVQKFTKGVIYVTPLGDFYRLGRSNLTKEYLRLGGSRGPWGWPTSDTITIDGVQVVQFEGATVVSERGVLDVSDPVPTVLLEAWFGYGGSGRLGGPAANAVSLDGGVYQDFGAGYVFVAPDGTATYRKGSSALTQAYMADGGPSGPWGWPLTDAVKVGDAYVVEFQNVTVESRGNDLTVIDK